MSGFIENDILASFTLKAGFMIDTYWGESRNTYVDELKV